MLSWAFHTWDKKRGVLIVERHSASTLKSFKIIFPIRLSWPFITWVACKDTLALQRRFSHQRQRLSRAYEELAHRSLPVHNGRGTAKARKRIQTESSNSRTRTKRCRAGNQSFVHPTGCAVLLAVVPFSMLQVNTLKKKSGNYSLKVKKTKTKQCCFNICRQRLHQPEMYLFMLNTYFPVYF